MYNFDSKIKHMDEELKAIKKDLKRASEFTQKFLNKCGKEGYTRISIGKQTDKIEATKTWPFGFSGSVFGHPSGVKKNGWPAIWSVIEELKISGGCGNGEQHQVSGDNLIEGVFELKKNKWIRIE